MHHMSSYRVVLALLLYTAVVHGENFSISFQNADDVLTYGEAHLSNSSTLLLTTVDSQASGVALYPSQVTAHVGFVTQFLWTPTICDDMISLAPSNYSDGVSFFMTMNPLDQTELENSQPFIGIGRLSNLFAVAYVTSYNEFYLCEWFDEEPANYDASLFRSKCRVFPNPGDRYTCGTFAFNIEFEYYTSRLTVRVNERDHFVAVTKVPEGRYFVGLAANNDLYARQQEIVEWTWYSKLIVDRFVQQGSSFPFVYGVAEVVDRVIHVNRASTDPFRDHHGAVFYEHLVVPYNYFTSKFAYSATQCTSYGGLSFGMVFMKKPSLPVFPMQMASLIALNIANTTIIGYSRPTNSFYICRTGPNAPDGNCPMIPSAVPNLPCNRAHQFEIMYEDGIVQIYVNGKFAAAGNLLFDSQPYVIGLIGSAAIQTPGQQGIANWIYDTTRRSIVTTKFRLGTAHNDSLSFHQNAAVSGNKITVNSPGSSAGQIGIVFFDQPFAAHLGFKSRIRVQTLPLPGCIPITQSHTSRVTLFFTPDRPTAEQLQNATQEYFGRSDVHSFTLDVSWRELRYCNRVISGCSTVMFPGNWPPLNQRCNPWDGAIDVIYTGRKLIVMLSDLSEVEFQIPTAESENVINLPIIMEQGQYYAGIFGYNTGREMLISDWTFERYYTQRTVQFNMSFDSLHNHFAFLGNTSLVANKLRIAESGLAVHTTPFFAHKGFSTEFKWQPLCSGEVPKAKGFSLFFAKSRPALDMAWKSDPETGQFGIATLPEVVSISYKKAENTFYAHYGKLSGGVTFNMVNADFIDCDAIHRVKIVFGARNTVFIYINDMLIALLGGELGSIIERSYYYVGFAGEGAQLIDSWQYTAVVPQTQIIEYGFDNKTHIEVFGTASLTDDTLRLTTGGSQSGAAMYPVPVYAHTGFNASITWNPSNCDQANNGADGFTLFFTKNLPLYEEVYNSAGGLLGIGNVPNTIMLAYSATFNQFYVCEWVVPLVEQFRWACDYVANVPGPKYTCPDTHTFDFTYNHQVLEIRANGELKLSAASLNFDPVQYYVGISGATGGGYFQQDISRWYFESIVL